MSIARRPLLTDVVRDELMHAIASGEFAPGAKLPNESLLSERFAVSRATIREAVGALVEQGYLQRIHGSGTYVLARPRLENSLDVNFSYTELIAASGRTPGERCVSLRREPASGEVADALGIAEDAEVVRLERVRTADGAPVIFSIDHLPGHIVESDVGEERLQHSIYALLAELGHPVHHGEATLQPDVVDKAMADILQCPPGSLVQRLDQVDFGTDGERLMYSQEWHLPPVIELRVFRRGPGDVRSEASGS
jgi:DNA-binding GntR family transcriptional regulator